MTRPHDAQTPTAQAMIRLDPAGLAIYCVNEAAKRGISEYVIVSELLTQCSTALTAERELVREETIEECAKVCESRFHGSGYRNEHERFGANQELSACATAIRTLSRAESAPE